VPGFFAPGIAPGRLNGGPPWSTLAARLVAVPGPRAWPLDAWAVPLVSHHLGRWPWALDLVPGGRDPAGPVAAGRATWCVLSVPGHIIR
jgi:hypothetical protein